MKAYWHILTDNIMEQYEFTPYLQLQEYGCSIIPPDMLELSKKDKPIFLIVNMHTESFDAFSFFSTLKDIQISQSITIIAYSDIKHDHEGIHKAKAHGVKHICTKDQVKELLAHIRQAHTPNN